MNILIVRNDKLGDFITALPTLYVLKNYDKNNKITALVAPLNKELAEFCPFIDEVIVDDKAGSAFALAKKLRRYDFDVSITLFSNTRVALAQFLAKIPLRIAPATKIAQVFYNRRVIQRRSQVKMAEYQYNLELTKALFSDISLEFPKPLCAFDVKKEDIVVFHPGFGGSSDANFSLDEYVEMVDVVLQQGRYRVVLTFGPDEETLMQTMRTKLEGKDVEFKISKEGIVAFAKYLASVRLFVSTSTGTYHLASLVGTPTLTFFADTLFASSKRWKSIGDEKLQKHYMLPQDEQGRRGILEEVKRELKVF